jgi:hypothetical protein
LNLPTPNGAASRRLSWRWSSAVLSSIVDRATVSDVLPFRTLSSLHIL